MTSITSESQQSMYDLCLMAYGTLDLMVKFCTDNGINDLNYIPALPQMFEYDPTLVTDQSVSNYVYTTAIANGLLAGQKYYVNQSGNKYISQNGSFYVPIN